MHAYFSILIARRLLMLEKQLQSFPIFNSLIFYRITFSRPFNLEKLGVYLLLNVLSMQYFHDFENIFYLLLDI